MISALVLAAGEAKRFGRCKQLMPLGEKSLLDHVLDNLRQSKVDDVVVVLGAHADEIQQRIHFDKERVVLNPHYADGMSTSIQAGLRALPAAAEAAMIVLADQPFVRSTTLDALVDEYRRTRASVVLPTYNGFRGNPVIVDRALFDELMGIRGDIGCRSIFGDHAESIVKVAVDDPGVVTDIDTPEDLDTPRERSASPLGAQRQGVIEVPMQCYSGGVLDVFIEPNLPRPQIVVVGHETIARERRAGRLKKAPAASVAAPAVAPVVATDPICQMTVTIADARYTAEHEGRRYYFCCQHCQRTFEKEPQRYAHVA